MTFALQYRVGFCHTSHFATPWTIARQAPLSMGFPTRQVCGNPCSSKKGEWSADQAPDVDTGGHLPFGFHQFLFLESLPGGTHTLWILITCGRLTRFLIRLLCPGTSAESFYPGGKIWNDRVKGYGSIYTASEASLNNQQQQQKMGMFAPGCHSAAHHLSKAESKFCFLQRTRCQCWGRGHHPPHLHTN